MSQRFNGVTINQTVVSLTAATSTPLVAANPLRKYLALQNIGTGDTTLAFNGATAVAGQGFLLAAGAALFFEASAVPFGAINGISTPGSTVVVLEGL